MTWSKYIFKNNFFCYKLCFLQYYTYSECPEEMGFFQKKDNNTWATIRILTHNTMYKTYKAFTDMNTITCLMPLQKHCPLESCPMNKSPILFVVRHPPPPTAWCLPLVTQSTCRSVAHSRHIQRISTSSCRTLRHRGLLLAQAGWREKQATIVFTVMILERFRNDL